MHGPRLRIGVVVPSSNSTVESELHRAAPDGVSIHSARVHQVETDVADEKIATILRMNEQLDGAVDDLVSVVPGAIGFACTAASFLNGPQEDERICIKHSKQAGIPFVTASRALALAVNALGARRVAIATPYLDSINERERIYFESATSAQVVEIRGLGIVGNLPKGRLGPEAAYELALQVDRPEAGAIVISCTNWRTLESIEALESRLGKPVLTSNQALLWACLRSGGIADQVPGLGRIMEISHWKIPAPIQES